MPFSLQKNESFSELTRVIVQKEIQTETRIAFFAEVDLTQVDQVRKQFEAMGKPKPSYTSFVVKSVSEVLKSSPSVNRRLYRAPFWQLWRWKIQQFENIDITVQAEREVSGSETATFADCLRDADKKDLLHIQDWLENLAKSDVSNNAQWRSYLYLATKIPLFISQFIIHLPVISPSFWYKYRGGAVLVNSPAKYGIDFIAGTWPWPMTISFGLVKKRPIVKNDQVVVCPTFNLIFSFDRRVIAGAQAGRFFKKISDTLENFEVTFKQEL